MKKKQLAWLLSLSLLLTGCDEILLEESNLYENEDYMEENEIPKNDINDIFYIGESIEINGRHFIAHTNDKREILIYEDVYPSFSPTTKDDLKQLIEKDNITYYYDEQQEKYISTDLIRIEITNEDTINMVINALEIK